MPRAFRLTRSDFERVARSKGARVHGEYFSLLAAPLPGATGPKFACVVSKKISPKSVVRNSIERRAREAVRPLLRKRTEPVAFILYPKREATAASASVMKRDIERLFSRI